MPEQPVKGEEALRRMAAKALSQPSKLKEGSDEDPIEAARQMKRKMIADDMIDAEASKVRAATAKAEAEAREAEARARRAEGGGDESGKSGFKITGGVDLGHVDLQKEREEAAAELKRMKQEADDSAKAVGQENQQLRERIHEKENQVLEITLKAQMEQLADLVKSNASKGTFMDQYNIMMENIKTLGFSRPEGVGDLTTQIELKKLEFENARELRRLSREDKAEERKWQMDLRRLDDDRDFRRQELAQQQKRDEMFANAPKLIGGAIAEGLLAKGESGIAEKPKGKKGYRVEIGEGESATLECPGCSQPVGVGPTARKAVCANCGMEMPVKRVSPSEEPEEE